MLVISRRVYQITFIKCQNNNTTFMLVISRRVYQITFIKCQNNNTTFMLVLNRRVQQWSVKTTTLAET